MGLDIYVGSLTRYYCGDWETAVQRFAREQGMTCQVIRPRGDEGPPAGPSEVQELVLEWRRQLNVALADDLECPLAWNESVEAPYFTDKPAWECYGELLLWAAYDEHPELPRPTESVEDWAGDAAWKASSADDFPTRYPNLLRGVELWLPCGFDFGFMGPDPGGRDIVLGSSMRLLAELEELNAHTWQAEASTAAGWRREASEYGAPLERGARFAFAIMLELAGKSVEHALPMKLDY